MVRSDLGASGVMFTLDTDSGFRDVVFITALYGLGETVVQGAVNPDEFYAYKPSVRAGKAAIVRRNLGGKAIKMVYGAPGSGERVKTVDVPEAERQRFSILDERHPRARETGTHHRGPLQAADGHQWGKDGSTGEIFILQARPETVQKPRRPHHPALRAQAPLEGNQSRWWCRANQN